MNLTTLENVMLLASDESGLQKVGVGSLLTLNSSDGEAIAVFVLNDVPAESKGAQIVKEIERQLEDAAAKAAFLLHPEGEVH